MQWHSTAGGDRGVSREERRASGRKDQAERGEDRQRRGEGGGKTRVHPEHVYGQKCDSPRLAIVPISDFKDVLIQQVNMRVGLWHNIPLPWHRNLHKDFTSTWLSFN